MDYSEQLSHPNWRKKREEALNHYGKKCSECGASNDLQVHHKRYIKGQKAWECSLDDLEVLCMKHHRITHGIDDELKVCEYKGCKKEIDPKFKYCFKSSILSGMAINGVTVLYKPKQDIGFLTGSFIHNSSLKLGLI